MVQTFLVQHTLLIESQRIDFNHLFRGLWFDDATLCEVKLHSNSRPKIEPKAAVFLLHTYMHIRGNADTMNDMFMSVSTELLTLAPNSP